MMCQQRSWKSWYWSLYKDALETEVSVV